MTFLLVAIANFAVAGLNVHLYIEDPNMVNLMIAMAAFGTGQVALPESFRRLKAQDS